MDKIFETARDIGCLIRYMEVELIGRKHLKTYQVNWFKQQEKKS